MRDPLKSLPGNDRARSRNHQMYYNVVTIYYLLHDKRQILKFCLFLSGHEKRVFLKTLHKQVMSRFIEIIEKKTES